MTGHGDNESQHPRIARHSISLITPRNNVINSTKEGIEDKGGRSKVGVEKWSARFHDAVFIVQKGQHIWPCNVLSIRTTHPNMEVRQKARQSGRDAGLIGANSNLSSSPSYSPAPLMTSILSGALVAGGFYYGFSYLIESRSVLLITPSSGEIPNMFSEHTNTAQSQSTVEPLGSIHLCIH